MLLLIIIIILSYHHHHHLFENLHFFHAKVGLDIYSYEVRPHIPEYCTFKLQTMLFHFILHTFSPSLPFQVFIPLHLTSATSTFLQGNTQSSTLLRSRCSNQFNLPCLASCHICHTLYTQNTVHIVLSILQQHFKHPSHHQPPRFLQTVQIFSLHRPGFSPICQHTLNTRSVYLSFYVV